jgi:hypothetical protein
MTTQPVARATHCTVCGKPLLTARRTNGYTTCKACAPQSRRVQCVDCGKAYWTRAKATTQPRCEACKIAATPVAETIYPCRECGQPVEAYRRKKGFAVCNPCATKRHAKSEARAKERREAITVQCAWRCTKCECLGVSVPHTRVKALCDWCAEEVARDKIGQFAEYRSLLEEKL